MALEQNSSLVNNEPLLRMKDIVVCYGSFVANDHIDLEVHEGEIHALLGENGAGKTTLMKALVGLVKPTSGTIAFGGKEVEIESPIKAQEIESGWFTNTSC